jgi:hypothetical protein
MVIWCIQVVRNKSRRERERAEDKGQRGRGSERDEERSSVREVHRAARTNEIQERSREQQRQLRYKHLIFGR